MGKSVAITKEIKRLEKSNINMTIIVPKDDVRDQYQKMLKEYANNMQMPGFRKGKVPQEVLERKFADALKHDALERIIKSALHEAFGENLPRNERPLPYSAPELQGEPELDLEQDLKFSVVYDVLPEVKIGQWKGMKVEYPYAEIEKEDIDRELEEIRERNAIVMDREDGAAAQKGDVITISYHIFEEDGQTPSNIKRDDFTYTLGSNANYYQFDDEITGMKKGESKEFEKNFASDFFETDVVGKTRKVRITLASLKEKKLPDLDDDLAQDVDEKYKTLADLKDSIRERLAKNLEWRLREKKLNELLKKIMENTPVTLPESMIRAEIEGRWRRIARLYDTSHEAMMQVIANDPEYEEKMKGWRESAEKALHSRIIIETLIEEQNIEASEEDVEKEFERMASVNEVEVDEVKGHYNEQAMSNLKEEIKDQKITDILLAENTLNPGKKENYLDFITDNS
jgi:trigger factor